MKHAWPASLFVLFALTALPPPAAATERDQPTAGRAPSAPASHRHLATAAPRTGGREVAVSSRDGAPTARAARGEARSPAGSREAAGRSGVGSREAVTQRSRGSAAEPTQAGRGRAEASARNQREVATRGQREASTAGRASANAARRPGRELSPAAARAARDPNSVPARSPRDPNSTTPRAPQEAVLADARSRQDATPAEARSADRSARPAPTASASPGGAGTDSAAAPASAAPETASAAATRRAQREAARAAQAERSAAAAPRGDRVATAEPTPAASPATAEASPAPAARADAAAAPTDTAAAPLSRAERRAAARARAEAARAAEAQAQPAPAAAGASSGTPADGAAPVRSATASSARDPALTVAAAATPLVATAALSAQAAAGAEKAAEPVATTTPAASRSEAAATGASARAEAVPGQPATAPAAAMAQAEASAAPPPSETARPGRVRGARAATLAETARPVAAAPAVHRTAGDAPPAEAWVRPVANEVEVPGASAEPRLHSGSAPALAPTSRPPLGAPNLQAMQLGLLGPGAGAVPPQRPIVVTPAQGTPLPGQGQGLPTLVQPPVQQPQPAAAPGVPRPPQAISVDAGAGRLVQLPAPAMTVMAADPRVLRVQPASPTSLFIMGVAPGRTNVIATAEDGTPVMEYDVTVTGGRAVAPTPGAAPPGLPMAVGPTRPPLSATAVESMIRRMVRGGEGVRVASMGLNGLILSGLVPSAAESQRAEAIAKTYAGEDRPVINNIQLLSGIQVNLRVRVAEMSRSITRDLGFNWRFLANDGQGMLIGIRTFGGGRVIDAITGTATSTSLGRYAIGYTSSRFDVNTIIDALATDQLIAILAEPNLTAQSGEVASFLAGGEFPVPVSASPITGAIGIEFKQFGVSLAFVPTVLSPERLNIRVRPEVSELSDNGAVTLPLGNGVVRIPALAVRRAETTVELGTGQSFAIAGLLSRNSTIINNGLIGLGDIPVLGALFRSDSFRRAETELVIIVTPYLVRPVSDPRALGAPTDGFRPATDLERLIWRRQISAGAPAAQPRLPANAGFIVE